MIKKRLLDVVPESKWYIAENVVFQWLGMCCNIVMIYMIASFLASLIDGEKAILRKKYCSDHDGCFIKGNVYKAGAECILSGI